MQIDLIHYFASLYYRLLSLGVAFDYDEAMMAFYRQYVWERPNTKLDYIDFCWNVNDDAEEFFRFCIIH